MEVTITYQDGRESDERGAMTVVDVDEPVETDDGGEVVVDG